MRPGREQPVWIITIVCLGVCCFLTDNLISGSPVNRPGLLYASSRTNSQTPGQLPKWIPPFLLEVRGKLVLLVNSLEPLRAPLLMCGMFSPRSQVLMWTLSLNHRDDPVTMPLWSQQQKVKWCLWQFGCGLLL